MLRDWTYFDTHPERQQLAELLLEIVLSLLRAPLPEERTTQLLRQLLLWYGEMFSGPHGADYVPLGGPIADALRDMLPKIPVSFLERDKPLRALAQAALALAEAAGPDDLETQRVASRLVALYRQVLRLGYLKIEEHLDVAKWAQSREVRLRHMADIAALFDFATAARDGAPNDGESISPSGGAPVAKSRPRR